MPYINASQDEFSKTAPAQCLGEVLPDLDQSLWSMFARTAAQYPFNDAVVSCWQQDLAGLFEATPEDQNNPHRNATSGPQISEGVLRWSYSDLLQRAEALAGWLQSHGCKRGMNLVALVWNSAEWALFFWASAKLGMVFVPLDPRVSSSAAGEYFKLTQPQVLVVQDDELAMAVEAVSADIPIRISCSSNRNDGWDMLSNALSFSDGKLTSDIEGVESQDSGKEIALIVFTSGTTSGRPKGCPHTASNLWSQTFDFDPNESGIYTDRWLVQTPASHIMGINNALRAWRYGGAVVLPAKSFDIMSSLKALQAEKCTRMAAVPTLIKAMVDHPAFPGMEALFLEYISLGGTIITAEHVKKCRNFGPAAAITAFGMSEGVPMTSWCRKDPLIATGHYPGVGKVLPGGNIRVCAPGTRNLLDRGVMGELHIGGSSIIKNYLGNEDADSFYEDEYGTWLKTGDLASIDNLDVLHISGRMKDLIIRGGENIAPARIESCLEALEGITAHVVGVPDSVAGEIPIAVVRSLLTHSKADLHAQVRELGPTYALGGIFTLDDLGIESFSLTATGKIRKDILREQVIAHMGLECPAASSDADESPANSSVGTPPGSPIAEASPVSTLTEQLKAIWTDLGATTPDSMDRLSEFSDSITMLRYCDKVWRQLGKKIHLGDMIEHGTIAKQAEFLARQQSNITLNTTQTESLTPTGLPVMANITFAINDTKRFDQISSAANNLLRQFGMLSEDLEDILPIKDSIHFLADGPRPHSYRHRALFKIKEHSAEAVRLALMKGLNSRPMFRTLLAHMPSGEPFHVVVRPSEHLYDQLITTCSVPDALSMQAIYQDDSAAPFLREKMFEATIVTVTATGSTFLILTYSHSTFDAISMMHWNNDLDRLIMNLDVEIVSPTPFKLFADIVHSYDTSPPANSDVDFFVRRLRGISRFPDALWPAQRAPGWMSGNDEGSQHYLLRSALRKQQNITTTSFPRVIKSLRCAHMPEMKSKHGVQPSLIAKAAIAIFNVQQTGSEYAIFNNLDHGREWPFILPWMKQALPPAMSIDGPTVEWTLNMLHIIPSETVGAFLERIEKDQRELSRHAHAPWSRVLEKLGEEAEVVKDASQRQSFNWDVSLKYLLGSEIGGFKALQPAGRVDWPDCGMFWGAGMLSENTVCLSATFDEMQLSVVEVNLHIQNVLEVIGKLADPQNWDSTVADVFMHTGGVHNTKC